MTDQTQLGFNDDPSQESDETNTETISIAQDLQESVEETRIAGTRADADSDVALAVPFDDIELASTRTPAVGATGDEGEVGKRRANSGEGEHIEVTFLPTNRYNLIEVLTSGLLKPRAGYSQKYYSDLHERSMGYIPLAHEPVDTDVVTELSSEHVSAIPILISLSGMESSEERPPSPFSFVPGVIPASMIDEIITRSEHDRADITARPLANLDWDAVNFAIDPAMFDGSATMAEFDSAFAALRKSGKPTAEQIRIADRIGGGLAMAFDAARTVREFEFMTNLLAGGRPSMKRFGGDLSFLAGGRMRTFAAAKPKVPEPESTLFEVAAEIVLSTDANTRWSAEAILADIWDRLGAVSSDAVQRFSDSFEYMLQVIRIERDLLPFTAEAPAMPKALLMFLLRPQPDDVSTWRDDVYDAGQAELVAAATLSGLLTGHAQLPLSRRRPDLETLIGLRQASVLNKGVDGSVQVEPLQKLETQVDLQIGREGVGVISATLGEYPVFQRDVNVDLRVLLLECELEPDWPSLLGFARDLEWGDACIRTTVDASCLGRETASETIFQGYFEPRYSVDVAALRLGASEHDIPVPAERTHRSRIIADIDAAAVRDAIDNSYQEVGGA